MVKLFLIALTTIIILTACTLREETKADTTDTTSENITNNPNKQNMRKTATSDTIEVKDSITHINVSKSTVWIKGIIKPGQHPSFTFDVNNKDSIIADVKPTDANGNIRIAQIEMPDKSMDGPFGNELRYKTKSNGKYRIILGQNMMAGDPYTGGYYLSITVK